MRTSVAIGVGTQAASRPLNGSATTLEQWLQRDR